MDKLEAEFLERNKGNNVCVIMRNGFQLKGKLLDYGNETLLVKGNDDLGQESLIYRDNISTIHQKKF